MVACGAGRRSRPVEVDRITPRPFEHIPRECMANTRCQPRTITRSRDGPGHVLIQRGQQTVNGLTMRDVDNSNARALENMGRSGRRAKCEQREQEKRYWSHAVARSVDGALTFRASRTENSLDAGAAKLTARRRRGIAPPSLMSTFLSTIMIAFREAWTEKDRDHADGPGPLCGFAPTRAVAPPGYSSVPCCPRSPGSGRGRSNCPCISLCHRD